MAIDKLLNFVSKHDASDLHISTGEPAMIRVYGKIRKTQSPPFTREKVESLIEEILSDEQLHEFQQSHEIDLAHEDGYGRYRVNVFQHQRGPSIVFRAIPSKISSLSELRIPDISRAICETKQGLVLVTGPTGHGKSTTLAAMIQHINNSRQAHIITIEDPIEFVYKSKKCLIHQRQVGRHTHSFANALRSALREDPDIILVGEMRDLETISLALTAAETGHLVFATLHTTSAAKTVDRIIDAFPSNQQTQVRLMVSETLQAVFSQTLIPRADGKGRIAAVEVLLGTNSVRNLIREGKTPQLISTMQSSQQYGMQTLEFAYKQLVEKGLIGEEELERFSKYS